MSSFYETLALSAIMGFSIYLSLPMVLGRGGGAKRTKFLNAGAIGILVFIMGDLFANAVPALYNGSFYGFGSDPANDLVFFAAFLAGFLFLFLFEGRSKSGLSAVRLSLIIAVGIGFQNLTEGLVFGSLGVSIGFVGPTLVVLFGFILQNTTEGFPIVSPFFGETQGHTREVLALLLVGGVPTVIGGGIGYFYNSTVFSLLFDGIAVGTILYVLMPMFKHLLRDNDPAMQRMAYLGVLVGFGVGYLVNLI